VLDRQHAPHHRTVQERDEDRRSPRTPVAAQDAADEHVGDDAVHEAARADVDGVAREEPYQDAGTTYTAGSTKREESGYRYRSAVPAISNGSALDARCSTSPCRSGAITMPPRPATSRGWMPNRCRSSPNAHDTK
jgi:hypothetical protein